MVLALIACLFGMFLLSRDAHDKINALTTARTDNAIWALSQLEVELLALDLALSRDTGAGAVPAARVRNQLGVFAARVRSIQTGDGFAALRADPEVAAYLAVLEDFLNAVPNLGAGNAPPDALPLAEMRDSLAELRPALRNLVVLGVAATSERALLQRQQVTTALQRLATLSVVLGLALAGISALVAGFARQARIQTEATRATQDRLAAVVATSLDAIIVADSHGTIVEFNPAAERIFGFLQQEVRGKSLASTIVPEHLQEAHRAGMARYMLTRTPHMVGRGRVTMQARHKSGQLFPVELSISSAQGPDGTVFISVLRDVSDRLAKEQELVEARDRAVSGERAKAQMMAIMSHEMRTPLNGVLGALDLLSRTELAPKQDRFLAMMKSSAEALLHHLNDVLEVVRLDGQDQQTDTHPFDPASIAREVLAEYEQMAKEADNALLLDTPQAGSVALLGSPRSFRQILSNLVGNAIKFTNGGMIKVTLRPDPEAQICEIRVQDDGIGIDPKDRDRIFEDFVTLDASCGRAHDGIGLGLGIVRRHVAAFGGALGVDSLPGAGSTFWVRLPLAQPLAQAEPPPGQDHPARVLVVDDNETNRIVLQEMLESQGAGVEVAPDGQRAVAMARDTRFDVILMDISMPGMDGLETLQRLRAGAARNRLTPVLAVTAHVLEQEHRRFRDAGFDGVITKPVTRATLEFEFRRHGLVWTTPPGDRDSGVLPRDDPRFDAIRDRLLDDITALLAGWDAKGGSPGAGSKDAVHKMAGTAAVLGLKEVHLALGSIEVALEQDDADSLRAAVSDLHGACARSRPSDRIKAAY